MPANSAEYQRKYRSLRKDERTSLHATLLEIKEELASLRKLTEEIVRNQPLNGSLRKVPPDPPKESPSLIPNLIIPLDHEFDEIYQLYPRHVGKGAAQRAYRTARKKASFDMIVAGVRRLAVEHQASEAKFIPHPATWLNEERWLDEQPKPNGHSAVSIETPPDRAWVESVARRLEGLE